MNKPQDIIELSGWDFSVLVLISGVLSPLVFVVSCIVDVLKYLFHLIC